MIHLRQAKKSPKVRLIQTHLDQRERIRRYLKVLGVVTMMMTLKESRREAKIESQ